MSELSQRYRIRRANISYLLALIDRHGLAILDQPYTTYTSDFNKHRRRPPYDQKRTTDQTGKASAQAKNRSLTPAELKADNRKTNL
ncbi:MAG: hypothetical protein M3Z87_10730 [Lactobacillus sp.]|nr:hypothetical protein [Lactobacillus sp.]